MAPRETKGLYNLITGEDTYAGQNAQQPTTSRRVQSWIPQDDGQLHREAAEPIYLPTRLSGPVVSTYNFNYNDPNGNVIRTYFAAARTDFNAGTKTCNLYQNISSVWVQVSTVGTLADAPMFATLQNLLQMVDGATNWLFDGTSWVIVGIGMPYQGGYTRSNQYTGVPFWTPAIDTSQSGGFTCLIGRYYWFTNADQTSTRPIHESTASAPSPSTGAVTSVKVAVYQTPGLWSVAAGSTNITVSASSDNPGPTLPLGSVSPDAGLGPAVMSEAFAGKNLYINGTLIGVVAGVGVSGGQNYLQLTAASAVTIPNGRAAILDSRCTGWNVYASESDSSLVGQYLNVYVPVTQNLSTTPVFDQSPFISDPTNTFVPIFRPVRNDPPPPSKIIEVHKYRNFRTRTSAPNFFNFSANEEVTSGNNGDAVECVPGASSPYIAQQAVQTLPVVKTAGLGVNVSSSQDVVASVTITNQGRYSSPASDIALVVTGGDGTGFAGVPNVGFNQAGNYAYVYGVTITNSGSGYTVAPTLSFTSIYTIQAATGSAVLGSPNVWTNPNDVTLDDNTNFASTDTPSQYLYATQFGFSIPNGDNIAGIKVSFVGNSLGTDSINAYLLKAGVPVGAPRSIAVPGTSQTCTLGNSTDLWGAAWLPSDVDNASFGVALQGAAAMSSVINIQNLQMTVYYESAIPGGLQLLTNTLSDLVNETSFPDQSNRIRGMKSYSDALYIGSEKQCFPLYGQSLDDFAFAQVTSFDVGFAGRFTVQASAHGLLFLSYDRKAFVFPTSATSPYYSGPLHSDATESLIEIGKPMRTKFSTIDPTRLDEVVTSVYFFGIRNWWIISYPDTTGAWTTYVYDFNTRGWFQLQRGFSSLAVFEVSEGTQILVGGGTDGHTYVIDDLSGTFTTNTNLPPATWRPALINFGKDGAQHVAKYVELEFTNPDLINDLSINFWVDPTDVDNPGTGTPVKAFTPIKIGANRYRAWFTGVNSGTTCERLLVEIALKASQNAGAIRGAKLAADPAPGLLP